MLLVDRLLFFGELLQLFFDLIDLNVVLPATLRYTFLFEAFDGILKIVEFSLEIFDLLDKAAFNISALIQKVCSAFFDAGTDTLHYSAGVLNLLVNLVRRLVLRILIY